MLTNKVLLIKDRDGSKRIVPQLTFEIPQELASLVYSYQSLAYEEQAREMIEK